MKLPQIKMPAWWKRWYYTQVILGLASASNLAIGALDIHKMGIVTILPAVAWFCAGTCLGIMIWNVKVWRAYEHMDLMSDSMASLMTVKAEEIGEAIAGSLHEIHTGERPTGITRH